MMKKKTGYYTKEGFKQLKEKLRKLETEDRPKACQELATARAKGDLKENFEYHAAQESLALLDDRIYRLKNEIVSAHVIHKGDIDTSKVSILAKVSLENEASGEKFLHQIVTGEEANLKEGKISVDSPVARGLLGKRKGEKAVIKTPAGDVVLKILDITA